MEHDALELAAKADRPLVETARHPAIGHRTPLLHRRGE
jgi:hypothetical protein